MTLLIEIDGIAALTSGFVGLDSDSPLWDQDCHIIVERMRHARQLIGDLSLFEDINRFCGRSECVRTTVANRLGKYSLDVGDDQISECLLGFSKKPIIQKLLSGAEYDLTEKILSNLIDYFGERHYKHSLNKPTGFALSSRVARRDHDLCRYCGRLTVLRKKSAPDRRHIDHVTPYSFGGLTEERNLVVACEKCNLKKGANTPEMAGMKLLPIPNRGL